MYTRKRNGTVQYAKHFIFHVVFYCLVSPHCQTVNPSLFSLMRLLVGLLMLFLYTGRIPQTCNLYLFIYIFFCFLYCYDLLTLLPFFLSSFYFLCYSDSWCELNQFWQSTVTFPSFLFFLFCSVFTFIVVSFTMFFLPFFAF